MIRTREGTVTLEFDITEEGAVLTAFEGTGLYCWVPDHVNAGDREYPVTAVAKKAFLNSPSKEILLPPTRRKIDDWAFSKSAHLKDLILRGPVEDISELKLGKGILEGASAIEKVALGFDPSEDLSFLLALCVEKLPAPFLVRTGSLGTAEWYEGFDSALEAFLKTDDDATPDILCGEEDISYDGVGMVDGEMPGETPAYIRKKREEKASVCLVRLLRDKSLSGEKKAVFETFVRDHALGAKDPCAWDAIRHELNTELAYVKIYCDILEPDKAARDLMLQDMGRSAPEVRAFLLAGKGEEGSDFFDELRL